MSKTAKDLIGEWRKLSETIAGEPYRETEEGVLARCATELESVLSNNEKTELKFRKADRIMHNRICAEYSPEVCEIIEYFVRTVSPEYVLECINIVPAGRLWHITVEVKLDEKQ